MSTMAQWRGWLDARGLQTDTGKVKQVQSTKNKGLGVLQAIRGAWFENVNKPFVHVEEYKCTRSNEPLISAGIF